MKGVLSSFPFCALVLLPDSRMYAPRDSCVASSARCVAATDEKGPSLRIADRLLWVMLSRMGAVALGAGHRQTRNSDWVATQRVSFVLALEE